MADNIRIIGNINDIQRVNRLKLEDLNLLNLQVKNQTFGFENDYIEYFVYDGGGNLINSNYNYRDFKLPSDSYLTPGSKLPIIEIDPTTDLQLLGYISGQFKAQYNFQTRKVSSSDADLFINQISEDRTEIGIQSINISSEDLIKYGNSLINELENSPEQRYFILNFSNNIQLLVVNVAIKVEDSSILLKLYEPLIPNIFEKETCWITEEIIEPYVFDINLDTSVTPPETPKLKGPNFSIDLNIKQNLATEYQNYSNLISSLTGSSYNKVLNYMNDNSYDLNIDYTSFENFIHFSSAEKRLKIFYSKIKQIETYNNDINTITGSTNILKNEQTASIKNKIDNIVQNFDGFENYLYYESSSYAWPKTNENKPYSNKFISKKFYKTSPSSTWTFSHNLNELPQVISIYSSSGASLPTQSSTIGINTISLTFSSAVDGYVTLLSPNTLTWYNNYTGSANSYDENNLDHLYNIIPNYIKNDPDSYQSYYDFIDMIGHYFDNIWIYISSINELYNADNNLEKGVSKDIVYDALSSLGVKLYNSKGDDEFDNYINGLNSGSTLFIDDFSATSSYLNNLSKKDLLAETYKRIYHNIPLLSKTKGTSTGLQNLINTFGVSSSILSPKEFGGSTTKNEIKGYDNDKITIYNNTITGSVLSSLTSLQTTPTSSVEFTSPDLHFVDLSFSPQNELNVRLSSSIANLNPTFSLDDYIGDPGLMASSSYQSLIQQNNYFISASSAVSGSEKPLDYKGFIELVKYFDNSLFKMLKDFVPARANTLTGITIKSPILERNKIPVYQPNFTNQSILQAEFPSPELTEDVNSIYSFIEGDKKSYYTGEFSGSYVDIYNYFENTNPNPYLTPSSSFDINNFNHSDFNVLLNNVSSSVVSTSRKKLEKLYTVNNNIVNLTGSNNFEITSDVELQDSNLSLEGHQNSRYDGTKISSLKYNSYTSSSLLYSGDNSYGKTAVIDHNTRKIGLFTQITENIFLPSNKKNNVALRYLIDEDGNLTELNRRNKHWNELQNTFKLGDNLTVSLFDNQKYSDQKSTDGIKLIFDSGYNYTPMLYFSGSEPNVYFEYAGENVGKLFQAKNTINVSPGPAGYIYGGFGGVNGYPLSPSGSDTNKKVIYNVFDIVESNDGNSFTVGNTSTSVYPTYTVPAQGSYIFSNQFDIYIDLKGPQRSGSFKYEVISGSIVDGHPTGTTIGSPVIKTLTSAYAGDVIFRGSNFTRQGTVTINYTSDIDLNNTYLPLTIFDGPSNKVVTITTAEHTGQFALTGDDSETYYLTLINWTTTYSDDYTQTNEYLVLSKGSQGVLLDDDYILSAKSVSDFSSNQTGTLSFNFTTPEITLSKDDRIYFKLTKETLHTNATASFSTTGKLRNNLVANVFGDFVSAVGSANNRLISSSINNDTIILNSSLTGLENYQFVAEQGTGDNKVLYNKYGTVNEIFSPSIGDIVVIYWQGQNIELTIKNLGYLSSKRTITFTANLPSSLITQLNLSSAGNLLEGGVDVFLLLKKKPDETNVLLKFNKKAGNTSLGIIIPDNLHPDVLANIDTITKEVNQKLIDLGFQSGSL